jgi:hypothetical protein
MKNFDTKSNDNDLFRSQTDARFTTAPENDLGVSHLIMFMSGMERTER